MNEQESGAQFAARQHLQTVKTQETIIHGQQKEIERLTAALRVVQSSCGLLMGQVAAFEARAAGAPAEPTASELREQFDALQFNAQRLRNVVKLLGMESEVPESNAGLDGARGAVLGRIADKLRTPAAAGAGSQVEQDAARWRYVRDTETLETAVWEALEGTDCAPGGTLDRAAYAAGMDRAVDAAMQALAPTQPQDQPAQDRAEPWSDTERERFRHGLATGDRCKECSVILGGQHFAGCTEEGDKLPLSPSTLFNTKE